MTTAPSHRDVTLKVYEATRLVATLDIASLAELGRRAAGEPPPYVSVKQALGERLIVADLHETSISRKHLLIEVCGDGTIALQNESAKNSIALAGGERLRPGERRVLPLPVVCEIGSKVLRFEEVERDELPLQSLRERTLQPGHTPAHEMTLLRSIVDPAADLHSTVGGVDLLAWLQASMDVFQSAAASEKFLPQAAQAAVQMVALDTAAVLLYRDSKWSVAAISNRDEQAAAANWQASQTMLGRVLRERRTFYHVPPGFGLAQSLIGVQSIVAAPILDREGEIVGVLYGERRCGGLNSLAAPIRELEAKLFELLAYGVASGLARVEQEQLLIAERVRFEQFFTPELARMLELRGDDLLAPRDAEITVLFCDIKGFSRISNRAGAALAIEWVREALSVLSDCVADYQGVLIDYSGDSLEALWGAPLAADDHAARACSAALKMRESMPELSRQWESRLGEPTDICIGIHTGRAQVGNIGSRRKFKYGAFGTTVNLASRVETATRQIGVPLLVTKATAAGLPSNFHVRRLCTVRTVNIDEPVDLFELVPAPDAAWQSLKVRYEQALESFEKAHYVEAMVLLNKLASEFPGDKPTRKLIARNAASINQGAGVTDSVWCLESK